jgi:hypothetical protein
MHLDPIINSARSGSSMLCLQPQKVRDTYHKTIKHVQRCELSGRTSYNNLIQLSAKLQHTKKRQQKTYVETIARNRSKLTITLFRKCDHQTSRPDQAAQRRTGPYRAASRHRRRRRRRRTRLNGAYNRRYNRPELPATANQHGRPKRSPQSGPRQPGRPRRRTRRADRRR